MKDSKGHGSDTRGAYAEVTAAVTAAHQSGVSALPKQLPTAEQWANARAQQRKVVSQMVGAIHGGNPKNEWALGVIRRARAQHSQWIANQNKYGASK